MPLSTHEQARLVTRISERTKPDRTRPTFGFARLSQLCPTWPDPTLFLETYAQCHVITPHTCTPTRPLTYAQWRKQPAGRIPNDDLAVLFKSSLYNERHTRSSLAKEVGIKAHHRLHFHAMASAGGGWCLNQNNGSVTTKKPLTATLAQHAFSPVYHPQIERALLETLAPTVKSPLDRAASRLGDAMWRAVKASNLRVIAAEVAVCDRTKTYITTPGRPPRYLAPRVDAVGIDGRGVITIIDYKTCMGRKPNVLPSHVAQLRVNAHCFARCTGIKPTRCLLVYGMRSGEVHLIHFPFRV